MCMEIVGTVLKTKKQHRVTATMRERERREEERGHTDRQWPSSAGRRPSGHLMTTSLLS
jgi:hypothetical protein